MIFPASNNRPRILDVLASLAFGLLLATSTQAQMTDVLTFHNNPARTGQTLHEEVLNPGNVNSNQFGKLWTYPIDEKSFAEPLYSAGVEIPGQGLLNVLYVVTENDSVYAFDADSSNLIWHVSLCAPGETPYKNISTCSIAPEIGITATPVIDRNLGPDGTMFVLAESVDTSGNCFQRLHAMDLATGADTMPPAVVTGQYPGTGEDSIAGVDYFVPEHYYDRAALLLLNGIVYIGWTVHCNSRSATCWLMGYDEYTLDQSCIINLEPNSYWGSIWNSGGGPAADSDGNIYVATGNGGQQDWRSGFDTNGFPSDGDFGCCLVKLAVTNGALKIVDYFAPSNITYESYVDLDMGSSCPIVLPDMVDTNGNVRKLVLISAKDQNIYIADRSNLGKCTTNNNALYEELDNIFPGPFNSPPDNYGRSGGMWSVPAFFNGSMFFGPVRNPVKVFPFSNARLGALTSQSPATNSYPGATPSISANGASNGIVWTVEMIGDAALVEATNAVLHAYATTNLASELYNTSQAANHRDFLGTGQKFSPPMIASGRVYVATSNGISTYGLLDSSSLTPIQNWRNAHFGNPSNVGRGANSSTLTGDGIPNLVKYALGIDPLTPVDAAQLLTADFQSTSNQTSLTLTLNRWSKPADVTFSMDASFDMSNWSAVTNITILSDTISNLAIQYSPPANQQSNIFMRLQFLPNPPSQ